VSIRIANAPCSWGVLEFDAEKKAGCSRVLDEMRDAEYEGTELGDWGFMPTEPASLRAELERRSLSMVGAFVPVCLADEATHAEGARTAVRTAKLLAAVAEQPFIILADDNGKVSERTRNAGRIRSGMGLSDAQWKTFARGAEYVAREVRDATGVRTVFHHHCAGYVETPAEIDSFMALTSPDLVGLCLDTGHCAFGGGDPFETLRRHSERVHHMHFKDFSPAIGARAAREGLDYFGAVSAGVFCELGRGNVPFEGIVQELRRRSWDGWIVVEQDVLAGTGTPLESARRNRAFLRGLGL